MADKADRRRQRKLAKQKKKRQTRSRAGRDQATGGGKGDPRRGLSWPVDACYASDNWHEQGAEVDVLIGRVSEAGQAIAGTFRVDLRSEGVREGTLRGGLRSDQLSGVAAALSEQGDHAMVDLTPVQAAAIVRAAEALGVHPDARPALAILDGIAGEAPIEVLTGEPQAPRAPKPEGWFSRMVGKIVGSP